MDNNLEAAGAAAVMNACWLVRHYCRPHATIQRQRAAKVAELRAVVLRELERCHDPEPVLYALAVGLYDRSDGRFAACY